MKCPVCSAEISQNMAFCGKCGSPKPTGNNYAGTISPNHSKANKPKKSKKGILISILVFVVVYGVFSSIGGKMGESYASSATTTTMQQTTIAAVVNSEYSEIFSSRYIVESMDFFYGLECTSFAKVHPEGHVEKMSLGHKNDVVYQMRNVTYIPIEGYTEEQKQTLEQEIRNSYSGLENYSFCETSYVMGNNHFTVDFTFSELDKAENLDVLAQYGIIGAGATMVSLEKSTTDLLAAGFVKK